MRRRNEYFQIFVVTGLVSIIFLGGGIWRVMAGAKGSDPFPLLLAGCLLLPIAILAWYYDRQTNESGEIP